jgi:CheY-like chemotaxis protein
MNDKRAMNILVADKDTLIISPIVEQIQSWGYQAEGSRSAQEALEKVRKKPFELVLLDMSLPDMSAQDLIIKLKESKPDIGIVTMTDANSSGQEKEIRTLGIVYYMIKPVDETVLKEILDHISNKKLGKH